MSCKEGSCSFPLSLNRMVEFRLKRESEASLRTEGGLGVAKTGAIQDRVARTPRQEWKQDSV